MDFTLFTAVDDIRKIRRSSEYFPAEFWKHFRHFTQQIVAISSTEITDAGLIPAFRPVVSHLGMEVERFDFCIEIWIEEKRKRQSIVICTILHAMRSGQIVATCYPIQHVSNIADKRIG